MLNRTDVGNGRKLQAQILHALLQGRSPDRIELLRNGVAAATQRAWEGLVHRGAVVVNESGRVVAAYPLSATPTRHTVEVESFKIWANCAIDALAVPRMVGRSGRITSECAHCGAAITIAVDDQTVLGTPASIVLGYGGLADRCGRPAIEARCPYINFFCSMEHADSWARPGSWVGEFLPLPRAAAVAADRFRPIIDAYRSVFSPESSFASGRPRQQPGNR